MVVLYQIKPSSASVEELKVKKVKKVKAVKGVKEVLKCAS